MKCPNCKGDNLRVVDTRKYDTVIFRFRVCLNCQTVVRTSEEITEFMIISTPSPFQPISENP